MEERLEYYTKAVRNLIEKVLDDDSLEDKDKSLILELMQDEFEVVEV